MSLIRRISRQPRKDVNSLSVIRSEFDRLFDRLAWPGWGAGDDPSSPLADWAPAIDVSENEQGLTVRAELPGMTAADIHVSVADNRLTISGEKSESSERSGENFYHCERRFGSFRRVIEAEGRMDADKVNAEFADGVLTVHVPRHESARARQVEVKSGATAKSARRVAVATT